MWTQKFNFKLNVYTNEHNQSMRDAAGPNWLREWWGVFVCLEGRMRFRTQITNIFDRKAAPCSWPYNHNTMACKVGLRSLLLNNLASRCTTKDQ
jgi:hypothetical protein